MSPAEFAALWREYVNQLAACLIQMGGNADLPAGRRLVGSPYLTRIQYELLMACCCYCCEACLFRASGTLASSHVVSRCFHTIFFAALQTQLVSEATQLQGSLLMHQPDGSNVLQAAARVADGAATEPVTDADWAKVVLLADMLSVWCLSFAPCTGSLPDLRHHTRSHLQCITMTAGCRLAGYMLVHCHSGVALDAFCAGTQVATHLQLLGALAAV